ncbi:MAG: flagellar biosynthetic protein FliO [Spirochaetales bacterium]|nr:flagellar biosynthetic protein FliO [Spirochaetales bacterium]
MDDRSTPEVGTEVAPDPSAFPGEEDLVFATDSGEAAVSTDGPDVAEGPAAFGMWDLLRMLLVLITVLGAIYGLITLLRRRIPSGPDESDSPIKVLVTRNLGGSRDLHAVMVGKEVMLLGGNESGVQLITTIDDQETIDELVLAHSSGTASQRRTFGAVFAQWVGNLTVPGSGRGGPGASATGHEGGVRIGSGFVQSQQRRVRQMR